MTKKCYVILALCACFECHALCENQNGRKEIESACVKMQNARMEIKSAWVEMQSACMEIDHGHEVL
jgi:hypothetical protein